MKKGLLLFCGLALAIFTNRASAQDFDLEFYQYFTAHAADYGKTTAKDAFNQWKAKAPTDPLVVTQNGIKAYVLNRPNNIGPGNEPDDTNPQYLRARFDNDACDVILESTNDLVTIALQYRGANDTSPGAFQISYGANAASLATFILPEVTSASPGVVKYYNFPVDPFTQETGVRYVKIQRRNANSNVTPAITSLQSSLYRIATSTTPFTSLPLELLSFNAKADAFGKSVNLNWRTTDEKGTKNFTIERRTDDSDFVALGTVESENTSGIHNYAFTDNNPVSGNAYYRLKQTDIDGKFTYSDIQSVNIAGGVSVSAYPNPATDNLSVSHAVASNGTIKVYNLQGESLVEQALANGSTTTNVSVASLAVGTYVLVVDNAGQQSTVKFVKN